MAVKRSSRRRALIHRTRNGSRDRCISCNSASSVVCMFTLRQLNQSHSANDSPVWCVLALQLRHYRPSLRGRALHPLHFSFLKWFICTGMYSHLPDLPHITVLLPTPLFLPSVLRTRSTIEAGDLYSQQPGNPKHLAIGTKSELDSPSLMIEVCGSQMPQ